MTLDQSKNILEYFRRTKDVILRYGDGKLVVNIFTDLSFQYNKDCYWSLLEYMFCLNIGVVSWINSELTIIAENTTKAEYVATVVAGFYHIFLRFSKKL